jgi:hypothetical protein
MQSDTNCEIAWPGRTDLIIKILSPALAAEKLGCEVKDVLARRQKLGLRKVKTRRQRLAKRKAK